MFKPDRTSITYEPLSSNEIRLVKFTAIEQSSFSIALETVNANSSPDYDALSYQWGEKTGSISVSSPGKPDCATITPNLLSALTRLWSYSRNRAIWIDALCINQQDIAERTQQVAMMTLTFNNAAKVLIWLGEEDETSPLAFELLRYSTQIAAKAYRWNIQPYINTFRQKLNQLSAHVDAVRQLQNRPYWSRLWVVQEVILATDAVILCGNCTMSWTEFQNAFYFLERCGIGALLQNALWSNLNHSRSKYKKEEEKEYFGLTRMLYRNRPHKATDPRDKVFGLLGVANEASNLAFRADYSHPLRDVYVSFTRELLLQDSNLELLGAVQLSKKELALLGMTLETASEIELPSWVADWSMGWIAYPLSPPNFDGSSSYFAAGSTKPSAKRVVNNLDKISLRGVVVDQIKGIHSGDRKFDHVPLAKYISDMVHILGLPERYSHTDEIANHALFHTMNADLSGLSKRIDSSHKTMNYPEYSAWASSGPTSIDSMPPAVEEEQKAKHRTGVQSQGLHGDGAWFPWTGSYDHESGGFDCRVVGR